MGCVCCSLSAFISVVLDALERISLCTVCAMLTCCLLFTILTVLVLGIGIGYHYCFVQTSVEAMSKAAKAVSDKGLTDPTRRHGNLMRSVNKAVQRGFAHRHSRRDADAPLEGNLTLTNYTGPENFTVFSDLTPIQLSSNNTTNYTVFS